MFETFKKQIKPIKLMLISDCFECFVAAFVGPYLTKAIYGDAHVEVWILALCQMICCAASIIWNKVYSEKRRYMLFRKTYLIGLYGYAIGMCLAAFVGMHSVVGYFWMECGVGVTLGRVWSQGNTELFGNLFSTEERKDYDRLQSSCCATANMLAAGLVCLTSKKFALPFSITLIVWCSSYFMDAFSMGYVFRYGMKNKLLEPRSEK